MMGGFVRGLAGAAFVALTACGRIGYELLLPADATPSDVHETVDATSDTGLDAGLDRIDAVVVVDATDAVDVVQDTALDAGLDSPGDAGVDVGACNWASGPPAFAPALSLGMPNTSRDEFDPVLSHDGLSLYFISYRTTSNDVFVATRTSLTASFGTGSLMSDVSTPSNETHFFVGPDGLEAFVASDRAGTIGMTDIFRSGRASSGATWTTFSDLTVVNSTNGEFDPHLEGDGLTLWFSPVGRTGGTGMQDIFFSRRADLLSPFSTPVAATTLNSTSNDWNDSLTDDGLVIVFSSDRSGSPHVYYSTRPNRLAVFGPPALVTALEPYASTLWDPFVTPDGCGIYFAARLTGGAGGLDLYVIQATP